MNHGRGLCSRCYHDPAVRCRYPVSRVGSSRRGVRDYYGPSPCPAFVTRAVAGSPEKVAVLAARAAAGARLFDPADGPDLDLD